MNKYVFIKGRKALIADRKDGQWTKNDPNGCRNPDCKYRDTKYEKPHIARGLCTACYGKMRDLGRLGEFAPIVKQHYMLNPENRGAVSGPGSRSKATQTPPAAIVEPTPTSPQLQPYGEGWRIPEGTKLMVLGAEGLNIVDPTHAVIVEG